MTEAPVNRLTCTQCGGELHPEEGQQFLTCPFCSATVFVDRTRVVFHHALHPTLDAQQAAAALHRWMSGAQTVKNLDTKAQVTGSTFEYFPLWLFKTRTPAGEKLELQPAAATSITELTKMTVPAGDLSPYDPALDAQATAPTVPLEAAREWLNRVQPGAEVLETSLVHVPIYVFKYIYKNQTYTAVVEAATGTVLANIFPAKAEAPFVLVALVTAGVYLFLASLPIVSGDSGLAGLAVIGGLVAAPLLFGWAAWVANKV